MQRFLISSAPPPLLAPRLALDDKAWRLNSDAPPSGAWHPGAAPGSSNDPSMLSPQPLLRTFIAEDSAIILSNLTETLEEWANVKVVGAASDEEATWRWLNAYGAQIDLVIVDIFLRAGSGLGLLHRLNASPTLKSLRRVVLTNYATSDMRQKCEALGADRVFDKSTDLDDLLAYCVALRQELDGSASS